ncbi:MAG: VOC family protein [Candidatus Roizmanbacteria bacterium]|nr:VOC family protein [Candidatus Roizmanbacteria bacterium]
MKMNPVVHFEIPAKNRKRVIDFYTKVFGWQMQQLGEEMGNYILAGTTEVDKNGMAKNPGAINGGFYETKKKEAPHLVISVDNLKKHMEIVKKEGGKILGKPMDIQGIGTFVMFTDTEGNKVGMLQPTAM